MCQTDLTIMFSSIHPTNLITDNIFFITLSFRNTFKNGQLHPTNQFPLNEHFKIEVFNCTAISPKLL